MRNTDNRRTLRIGGLLLIAVLLTGACSGGEKNSSEGDEGPGRSQVTVGTAAASTVPPSTAGQGQDVALAVEAAYREATAAEIQFDSEVGPFDPVAFKERVGRFLAGAQYEASFQISQQRRLRGEVFRPPGLQPGEIAPVVTVEAPGRAIVRDCAADHPTVKAATGERVDEPIVGRELVEIEMVLDGSQWKITDSTATGQPCVA